MDTGDAAERSVVRSEAVSLRLAGYTYPQIAERLGYSDKSTARNTVLRALDRYEHQQVDELRTVENARLYALTGAVWPLVEPEEGITVPGDLMLRAVDTALRISARRARLNGLDAPTEVIVNPSAAEVDQWVAAMWEATQPP